MGEAFVVGVIVTVPLVAGAVLATIRPVRRRLLATVVAFASGAMMAAVAFELVAAIFVGNFPEAVGGAAEMLRETPRRAVLAIW